jgi:mono/diheme cytochrome c family protein
VSQDTVVLFDPSTLAVRSFPLAGVTATAIGPDGRLYASTARAIYAARPAGDLGLVYDAGASSIHGLVAAGNHVWFADGTELGLVRDGDVAETNGARIAIDATLAGSPSGDVWVLSAGGVQRFADAASPTMDAWPTTLAAVFARSCSSCHAPDGVAGVDLSTAAAWDGERAAIRDRVVVSKTMPPEGHPLSDADRAAIEAWAR